MGFEKYDQCAFNFDDAVFDTEMECAVISKTDFEMPDVTVLSTNQVVESAKRELGNDPIIDALMTRAINSTSSTKSGLLLKRVDDRTVTYADSASADVHQYLTEEDGKLSILMGGIDGFSKYQVVEWADNSLKLDQDLKKPSYSVVKPTEDKDSHLMIQRYLALSSLRSVASQSIHLLLTKQLDGQSVSGVGNFVCGYGRGKTENLYLDAIRMIDDGKYICVLAKTNSAVNVVYLRFCKYGKQDYITVFQSKKNQDRYDYGDSRGLNFPGQRQVVVCTIAMYLKHNLIDQHYFDCMYVDEASLLSVYDGLFLFTTKIPLISLYGDPFQNDPFSVLQPSHRGEYPMLMGVQDALHNSGLTYKFMGSHCRAKGQRAILNYNFFYSPWDTIDSTPPGDLLTTYVYSPSVVSFADKSKYCDDTASLVSDLICGVSSYVILTPYVAQACLYSKMGLNVATWATCQGIEADEVFVDPVNWIDPQKNADFGWKSLLVVFSRMRERIFLVGRFPSRKILEDVFQADSLPFCSSTIRMYFLQGFMALQSLHGESFAMAIFIYDLFYREDGNYFPPPGKDKLGFDPTLAPAAKRKKYDKERLVDSSLEPDSSIIVGDFFDVSGDCGSDDL